MKRLLFLFFIICLLPISAYSYPIDKINFTYGTLLEAIDSGDTTDEVINIEYGANSGYPVWGQQCTRDYPCTVVVYDASCSQPSSCANREIMKVYDLVNGTPDTFTISSRNSEYPLCSSCSFAIGAKFSFPITADQAVGVTNRTDEYFCSWEATLETLACDTDLFADVTIVHKDGTINTYQASADTDVARGTALVAAVAAAVDGDTVRLGNHTYDIQESHLYLDESGTGTVHLRGAGKYTSIIEGQAHDGRGMVHPGDYSEITDLSIVDTDTGNCTYLISSTSSGYDSAWTNIEVRNVYLEGWCDNVYINRSGCSGTFINVDFVGNLDTFQSFSGGTFTIRDSTFTITDLDQTNTNAVSTANATMYLYDNIINSSGATGTAYGYRARSGSTYYVYGSHIYTNGDTAEYDLYAESGGTIYYTADTKFDSTKVSGDVFPMGNSASVEGYDLGTMTNGYLCSADTGNTEIDCNTATSTFQSADADLTTIAGLTPVQYKIMIGAATEWSVSNYTLASPGTSGNILKSDGTNWTSSNTLSLTSITDDVIWKDSSNSYGGIFEMSNIISSNKTFTFPNSTGTVCVDTGSGCGSGSGTVDNGVQYHLAYYPSNGTTVDDSPVTIDSSGYTVTTVKGPAVDSMLLRGGTSGSETKGVGFKAPSDEPISTYYLQFSSTAPSGGQGFSCGTPSSSLSQCTWISYAPLTSASLVTPDIGAATGTSLYAAGRIDGTVGMVISTADSATTISSTNNKSSYYMNIGDSDAHSIYTLPTAATGLQYCVTNYQNSGAITRAIKIITSAAGQYITVNGALSASGGYIISSGAAGDSACVVGVDSTHWVGYIQKGAWTIN